MLLPANSQPQQKEMGKARRPDNYDTIQRPVLELVSVRVSEVSAQISTGAALMLCKASNSIRRECELVPDGRGECHSVDFRLSVH